MKKSRAVAVSLVAMLAVTVGCDQQRAINPRTVRTEETNDAHGRVPRVPIGHGGYVGGASGANGATSNFGGGNSTVSSPTSRGGFGGNSGIGSTSGFGGTSSSAS